ncbi:MULTISPECIES: hypothetical protein [unclassified Streptomyces]|uniref:hypothetical protein n=1 Tax=unclassified Streptomyces TaxID=2593676 RepID=UPI000B81DE7A|nr:MULTISPECIES: hypothetical protein [unclassified Streptomyces]MYZ35198.1 hypothetical protein [Streptomyces sp. SID4917]
MRVRLRLDGGLHQVPGELDQQTAFAHQPQFAVMDLAGGELGQLVEQSGAQPVRAAASRLAAVVFDATPAPSTTSSDTATDMPLASSTR